MPLGFIMCLSSVILWSINLCRYLRDIVGVCVCCIHCVSSGVGRRGNCSSLLLRWMSLVVLNKNDVRVIGDLIQY